MIKIGSGINSKYLARAGALILALAVSCGGPYKGAQFNQPDLKLKAANELFDRGEYDKAEVDYKDFLAQFAGDERGDYAQFRLAECYRLDEDFALAAVEYRIMINDYGYSEYVDDAFYLEGLCSFEQAQRAERDQTRSYEALGRINRFLQLFPNSPRYQEALQTKVRIHDLLGRKTFLSAKLYFSKKHYGAALIYFDKILTYYPETIWASRSHYYKGQILEARDEGGNALGEYREAVNSQFDFDEKVEAFKRLQALSGEKRSE
ncbi:MAG: outer membrane protein assembly factor BamD [Candidatus Krumholzibacteriota bacterium]|nr:outer membrane protein assembly factor BamD [Candidatus Krumholzibacteriota bacterium]